MSKFSIKDFIKKYETLSEEELKIFIKKTIQTTSNDWAEFIVDESIPPYVKTDKEKDCYIGKSC